METSMVSGYFGAKENRVSLTDPLLTAVPLLRLWAWWSISAVYILTIESRSQERTMTLVSDSIHLP